MGKTGKATATIPKQPKYLMCVRALALASGLGGGLTGCGASLTNDSRQDAQPPSAYDGAMLGIGPPVVTDGHVSSPYDGAVVGVAPLNPDAHVTHPYDGGAIGIGPSPNRDAQVAHPYDGAAVGISALEPDADG